MILLRSLGYFSSLTIFGFVCLLQVIYCDSTSGTNTEKYFSSSIAGMLPLLESERQLLYALGNYTALWKKKLSVIRGAITEMRAENQKSKDNAEEYLSNPINSYALIRRLHEDWVSWQLFLQNSLGTDEVKRIEETQAELPSSSDFSDAVEGIYRLQVFAGLNPADMAEGILNGKQYNNSLSAKDCFGIGYELYSKNYYNLSGIWLNVSLQYFENLHPGDKAEVYEVYAQALQKQGRFSEALEEINNALHISPHQAEFLRTKSEIEFEIKTETNAEIKLAMMSEIKENITEEEVPSGNYEESSHGSECHNTDATSYPSSKLSCIYNRTASPFLYIAPFKMEILNLDPYLVIYHDVISDADIASLKELSIPTLKRAEAYHTVKEQPVITSGRVAHYTGFKDDTNDVTKRLNQRIADMTGFDLTKSHPLQINNYGLGGNFEPHYDFQDTAGMNDVEQGGATVFTKINATIRPQKGSALVWYNLDIEGVGDLETIHTGCPVIVGSKWVIIKMITEYGQIFRRPCQKKPKK